MEEYIKILEKVAKKEIFSTVFWVIIMLVIVLTIWLSNYFYYKKLKIKNPENYSLPKQVKARRKGFWASVALSAICFAIGAFFCFDTVSLVSDIEKDIEDESYITYSGRYYITDNSHLSNHIWYSKWLSADFENGGYAWVYMDSYFEWVSTEEGRFDGAVVYGKNSLIVVDIDNKDIK